MAEGEEYGFDVGVRLADVAHTVVFLVAAGELMLLDDAVHIVVHMGADHNAVLPFQRTVCTGHGLGIEVIVFFGIADEPAGFLELAELLCSAGIDALIVFARAFGEIDFGLDDVVERLFVAAGFRTGFLAVEDIVGTTFNEFNKILGRTNAAKGLYSWHSM